MKKILKSIKYIFLICLFLTACSPQIDTNKKEKDYDIAIFTNHNISTFKENGDILEKVETIEKDGTYSFMGSDYENLGNSLLIKTTAIGKDALLADINKGSLEIKLKKDNMEPYTFHYYKDKIYATNVFTDRFNIFVYDMNFKELTKKEVRMEGLNVTNDLIIKDDVIYLLMGHVDTNTRNVRNLILKLNMVFEIIEEIDLDYTSGAYLRMELDNNFLYITQNSNGLTANREPAGSNKLLKLNLATQEKEFIELDFYYPLEIYKDKENNKLIISHYNLYVPNYVWTIYDLASGERQIIYFDDRPRDRMELLYFNQNAENYYFLFADKLYRYNKKDLKETVYNLSDYGIDDADIAIFK